MPRGRSLHLGVGLPKYDGRSSSVPLRSAEGDARVMACIARHARFEPTTLLGPAATVYRVTYALDWLVEATEPGDTLLVTFAGHGGQLLAPPLEQALAPGAPPEEDYDETWELCDGALRDDDLYLRWMRLGAGARVVIVSDSCHSGGMGRDADEAGCVSAPRRRPAARMRGDDDDEVPRLRGTAAEENVARIVAAAQARRAGRKFGPTLRAGVLLLAACSERENANGAWRDTAGLFTQTLEEVWNGGRFSGSYEALMARVGDGVRRVTERQQPELVALGPAGEALRHERPFTIDPAWNQNGGPPDPPPATPLRFPDPPPPRETPRDGIRYR